MTDRALDGPVPRGTEGIHLLNRKRYQRLVAIDKPMAEAMAEAARERGYPAQVKNLGPKGYARSRWVVDVDTQPEG